MALAPAGRGIGAFGPVIGRFAPSLAPAGRVSWRFALSLWHLLPLVASFGAFGPVIGVARRHCPEGSGSPLRCEVIDSFVASVNIKR